jgi:hypothetical protein
VPFDRTYKTLFEAAIFAVHDCGFVARAAKEDEDSGRVRVQKIYDLIAESKYGIHDISRVTLDWKTGLPRFNMPLELGLWLGAVRYGSKRDREKRTLVMDKVDHRYQIFCSDISGQDIRGHANNAEQVVRRVRNWLRNSPEYKGSKFPGDETMVARYRVFREELPAIAREQGLNWRKLEFNDYATFVVAWLQENPH